MNKNILIFIIMAVLMASAVAAAAPFGLTEDAETAGKKTQWTGTPIYATAQKYAGSYSLNCNGALCQNVTNNLTNVLCTGWFYDDGATGGTKVNIFSVGAYDTNDNSGIGIHTGINASNYVFGYLGAGTSPTPIVRTIGWHNFSIFMNTTKGTVYVNGTLIRDNINGMSATLKYNINSNWNASNFYDNINCTFYTDPYVPSAEYIKNSTIYSPVAGYYTAPVVLVNYSACNYSSGVASYNISFWNSSNVMVDQYWNSENLTYIWPASFADGVYYLNVTCRVNDTFQNSSRSQNFTLDRVFPQFSSLYPPADDIPINISSACLNYTDVTYSAVIDSQYSCSFMFNNKTVIAFTSNPGNNTLGIERIYNTTALKNISLSCWDLAGNNNTQELFFYVNSNCAAPPANYINSQFNTREFQTTAEGLFWLGLLILWFASWIMSMTLTGFSSRPIGMLILFQFVMGLVVGLSWTFSYSWMIGLTVVLISSGTMYGMQKYR